MIRAVRLSFVGPHEKAAFMQRAAVADALHPLVVSVARRFAPFRGEQRAQHLHAFVRDGISYVRDNGGEELASAPVVLRRGYDDCDGKSRTLVALATACERLSPADVEARLVPVFPLPHVFSHVTAEFRWPNSWQHPRARDGWVRSETILAGCPLGAGTEAAKRGPNGSILYA